MPNETDYTDSVTDGVDEADLVKNSTKGGGVRYICEKSADSWVEWPSAAADAGKSSDASGLNPVSLAEAALGVHW